MWIGTASCDITPEPGVELGGYLFREQPSLSVHDRLKLRCIYVRSERDQLLWLHADLIGLEQPFVDRFRAWAITQFPVRADQVIVSTTHTHAGPATVHLIRCGEFDRDYLDRLLREMQRVAVEAVARPEPVELIATEAACDLAIDRRRTRTSHMDPRIGVAAWRRPDGAFAAVLATYGMHNVGLSCDNRAISADIFGHAANSLERSLSGGPVVLLCAGAAGNTNPPSSGEDFSQISRWGEMLAGNIGDALLSVGSPTEQRIETRRRKVRLPLEHFDDDRIELIAREVAALVSDDSSYRSRRFREAVEIWRTRMTDSVSRSAAPRSAEIELNLITLGHTHWLCINAEIFSRLGDDLRRLTGASVYVVGYANGLIGYVPTSEAYAEGGYETDSAFVFYGGVRPRQGGFELIRDRAVDLIGAGGAK
jgi:neutral ceramidase